MESAEEWMMIGRERDLQEMEEDDDDEGGGVDAIFFIIIISFTAVYRLIIYGVFNFYNL